MRKRHLKTAPREVTSGVLPGDSGAMKEVAIWTVLFAAVAVGASAFEVRREVVPLWRLALAPLAAVACALSLPPEPRWLGAAAGADIMPVVDFVSRRFTPPPFAAIAFLCAGYLTGRAASIGVRSRATPHDDMRPGAV